MSARWGEAVINGTRQESSLREFCTPVFRYKGKALALFVVLAGLVIISTFAAPQVYESEATLLVKPGRETVAADPTVPAGSIMYLSRKMEEELNSELEILRSRRLAEDVVDKIGSDRLIAAKATGGLGRKLGLAPRTGTHDAAVRAVLDSFGADVLRGTNILRVTFQSTDPALAQKALEDLIGAYLDLHVQVHETGSSYELFQRQTSTLRDELAKADEALNQFKKQAGVSSLHDQRMYLVENAGDLRLKSQEVASELAAARASVKALEEELAGLDRSVVYRTTTGTPNAFMDDARLRLLDLKLRDKELAVQYPASNRYVRTVRSQIQETEQATGGEPVTRTQVETVINKPYQDIQAALLAERAKLASLEEQDRSLRAQLEPMQAELQQLTDAEGHLVGLERQQAVLDSSYRQYVAKLEDARILQLLEREKISNIAVVQPATTPIRPVRPRKALNVILGLVLGLAGGVALAFLCDRLDHSFRSAKQVEEHLGIPVLVSIPESRTRALKV
jgi:succinoglycan biosynthesis transport protein ExoP